MTEGFANFLQRLLDERGITAPALAGLMGRTERTVYYWLRSARVPRDAVALLSDALDIPLANLRRALAGESVDTRGSSLAPLNYDWNAASDERTIPAFESVSAGPLGACDIEQLNREMGESGRFKVRIRGGSMSPDYPDGCWVVFSRPRAMADGLVDEKDYLVWTTAEESTFKRVVRDPSDPWQYLVLRPLNPDRRQFVEARLHRDQVAYVARAVKKEIDVP